MHLPAVNLGGKRPDVTRPRRINAVAKESLWLTGAVTPLFGVLRAALPQPLFQIGKPLEPLPVRLPGLLLALFQGRFLGGLLRGSGAAQGIEHVPFAFPAARKQCLPLRLLLRGQRLAFLVVLLSARPSAACAFSA